jgi:tetratricopeptide (TPR) repeat protein
VKTGYDALQKMKRLRSICLALAVSLAASAVSGAEPPSQAGREFDRGAAAAARGDYLDAAAAFMRAYELAPHAAALYNAALAWQAAGDRPRAADAYERALRMDGLASAQAKDARNRLEALERTLARLDVSGPQGTAVSVAHAERTPTPAQIHVEPGEYAMHVWFADGRTELKQVKARIGSIELRLEPPQEPAPSASTVPPKIEQPVASGSTSRTLGWVALGTGVALGGVTAWLGVTALDARDQYNDSGRTDRDAYDRAGSYRTWTNVALAGAVVLGATGLVLLLKPASKQPSQVGTLRVGAGPASFSVSAQF